MRRRKNRRIHHPCTYAILVMLSASPLALCITFPIFFVVCGYLLSDYPRMTLVGSFAAIAGLFGIWGFIKQQDALDTVAFWWERFFEELKEGTHRRL